MEAYEVRLVVSMGREAVCGYTITKKASGRNDSIPKRVGGLNPVTGAGGH